MVKFSPLLFVFVFVGLLVLTSSQSFINTQTASAATATIVPNGDVTTDWSVLGGSNDATCSAGTHCDYVDEGSTPVTTDYVSTGTNLGDGVVEEFNMTTVGAVSSATSVTIYFYMQTASLGSTADTVGISLRINGTLQAVTTVTPSLGSWGWHSATFNGTWSQSDVDSMQLYAIRNMIGTGPGGGRDDDILMAAAYAEVTYTASIDLNQRHYRWRDDSAALNTSSGWLAAEDTTISDIRKGDSLRLRIEVDNIGTVQGIQGFRLQWASKVTTCSAASGWTRVDTASDAWEMDASTQYADGDSLSSSFLTGDEPTFVNGFGLESPGDDTSANIQLDADDYTEVEWAISPTVNATDGATYCFRVVDDAGLSIAGYTAYPEATIFLPTESLLTQEAYIWEYDDGVNADSNSQQAAGNAAITSVKKGERLNLRTQLKNTGTDAETDNLALFYDKNDNIWTKVENDKLITGTGSGCSDFAWTCSTIDTGGTDNVGWYTDVVFDAAGVPWASYINQTTTSLEVAVYVGVGGTGCSGTTAWTCSVVDNTSAGGSQSSITISDNGTIWISYKEVSSGNLQVAQYVGSGGTGCGGSTTWTCTTIDSGAETGWFTDIAINPKTGNPWISYANNGTPFAFEVAQYVGSGGTGCAVSTWTCYTVLDDANDYGAEYTGIAFDAEGTAWTSFHDDTNGDLYVAKYVSTGGTGCTSSAWTCTAIATANDSGDIGTAIVVDSTGIPYVAFREVSTGGDLKIAQYLGGATTGTGCAVNTWNCTTIDSTGDVGAYASLAIDPAGNMWIGYRDTTNTNPKIARYLGGETTGTGCAVNTWACTSVKTGGDNDGAFTSLAIAPNGNIWFSFYDSTGGDAELAVLNRNAEIITSPSLSTTNGAVISESHTDMTTTGDTANRDDADCSTATTWNNGIHSTVEELTGLSLPAGDVTSQCTEVSWTIDTSQTLEGETYRFVVASKDNWRADKGVWRGPIDIVQYPTLTIESDTELRAAKATTPNFGTNCTIDTSWTCQTVATTSNSGYEATLRINPVDNTPWIAYADQTALELVVAEYVGSGGDCDTTEAGSDAWECTRVDTTASTAYYIDMAFSQDGTPFIAYTRGTPPSATTLYVAEFVGSGGTGCNDPAWTCTQVDNTAGAGAYAGIAFDINNNPIISHRDEVGQDLEFARYVGSGGNCSNTAWQCTTIAGTGNGGYVSSIQVSGEGQIYIAHQMFGDSASIHIAKYVGSGGNCDTSFGGSDAWQCTKVDDRSTEVGREMNMALDSNGNPWIAHQNNTTSNDLGVTYYVGGGNGNCNQIGTGSADWVCQVVQSNPATGYFPSISFDSNGTAHVATYNATTQRLLIASYVGVGGSCDNGFLANPGVWDCNEVTGSAGTFASIDFDNSDVAWVASTTGTYADLFVHKEKLPSTPLSANRLNNSVNSGDAEYRLDGLGYDDILTDDSALDVINGLASDTTFYTFEKEGITSSTKPININWTGQSDIAFGTNNGYLQIYRYGTTNAWETLATESACAANTDCTIGATISSNISEYSDSGVASIRVYQDDHTAAQTLSTDFIDISQPSEPMITQEAFIFENDDGTDADTNSQQVAGDTARTGVVKGERINLRTHIKNTGGTQPSDYALFYDRGDGLWSKVQNDAPDYGPSSSEDCNGFESGGSDFATQFYCNLINKGDNASDSQFVTMKVNPVSGLPTVAYADRETQTDLIVANYVGSGGNCSNFDASGGSDAWQCTRVFDGDSINDVGVIDIEFDSSGNLWIAFRNQESSTSDLVIANYVGSGGNCDGFDDVGGSDAWQCTTVFDGSNISDVNDLSLVIDNSDNAWVAFDDVNSGRDLIVANFVGTAGQNCDGFDGAGGSDLWSCTMVIDGDSTNDINTVEMLINSAGKPIIATQNLESGRDLVYVEYVGTAGQNCDGFDAAGGSDLWSCTTIIDGDSSSDFNKITGIILPSGKPAFATRNYEGSFRDLVYVEYVGTAGQNCDGFDAAGGSDLWSCTTVFNGEDSTDVSYIDMIISASGYPTIFFMQYEPNIFLGEEGGNSEGNEIAVARYIGSTGQNCDGFDGAGGSDLWNCFDFADGDDTTSYSSFSVAKNHSDEIIVAFNDLSTIGSVTSVGFARYGFSNEITLSPSTSASNGDAISESHTDMTTTVDTTNRDDADCITGGATWNNGIFSSAEEIPQLSIPLGEITAQCTELNFTIDTSQALEGESYRFVVATKDNWNSDKGIWRGPIQIDQYPTITVEADTDKRYSKAITPVWDGCDTYAGGSVGSADWSCLVVDDQTDAVGTSPMSIAIDNENRPWIAYNNGTDIDLVVARYVGSGGDCDTYDTGSAGSDAWECTVILKTGINAGVTPKIAFDKYGTAWIASNVNANLLMAKYVGSGGNCATFDTGSAGSAEWECFYVDSSADSLGVHSNLAFDSNGNPWISYKNTTDADLQIANYVGSGGNCDSYQAGAAGSDAWNCTKVDATNDVGDWSKLTIDNNNIPWISYRDTTASSLKVARYVGSGGNCDSTGGSDAWQCTVVDVQTDSVGNQTSITSSSAGEITVVHQNATDQSLIAAQYVGAGGGNCNSYAAGSTGSADWQCTVIDDQTAGVGFDIAATTGPDDRTWVAYQANSGSNIQAAYYVGTGGNCDNYAAGSTGSDAWQCIVVDQQSQGVGDYLDIAFDNSGIPWIASQNWSTSAIIIAKAKLAPGPLGANRGSNLIPSGDMNNRLDLLGYADVLSDDSALDDNNALLDQIPQYGLAKDFDDNTKPLQITWVGQSTVSMATNNTLVQMYNFSTNVWDTVETESTCAADTDCTISASVTSAGNYYSAKGAEYEVNVRLYQNKHSTSQTLKTDLISIEQPSPPMITQEGYIFENDDGTSPDTSTAQVAGATSITGVKKGERINLRTHIKNTGGFDPADYGLFYDRGDGYWSKVENESSITSVGNCPDNRFLCSNFAQSGDVGDRSSIAVDQTGRPGVTFIDRTNLALYYAEFVGSNGNCDSLLAGLDSWSCTLVDAVGTFSSGSRTKLQYEPTTGSPHIIYYDNTSSALKHATYVASGGNCDDTGGSDAWQCTTVDANGNMGVYSDLAISTNGEIWTSYHDVNNRAFKVATYVGSGGNCDDTGGSDAWQCTTVDDPASASTSSGETSIATDSRGSPWMSYRYNNDLYIAKYVGSGGNCDDTGGSDAWQCTVVDTTDNVGEYNSIVVDPSDNAWVSYYDLTNFELNVAKYVGSGGNCDTLGAGSDEWSCEVVEYFGGSSGTSIATNPSGQPTIAYYSGDLTIATYTGTGTETSCFNGSSNWYCTDVDTNGTSGVDPSIAFGYDGALWATHKYSNGANLRLVQLNRQAEITLSPSTSASNGASLAESHADMTTTIDTANRDDADCLTGGATWNNGFFSTAEEISSLSIPKGETTPQCTELSWTIDTSQALENTTYRFVVATKDNWNPSKGIWRGPIAIDQYPTITITADSDVRYSKGSIPSWTGCNTYATGSTGSPNWDCLVVDDQTAIAGGTLNGDMTVGADGEIYIAYQVNFDLAIAKYVGSGGNCDTYATGSTGSDAWECTIVFNHNTAISRPQGIEVSPAGMPIILFNTESPVGLSVAEYVGSGGNCDSFVVSSTGSDAWECTRIDFANVNSESLALNSSGVPYISYQGGSSALNVAKYVGSGGSCPNSLQWECTVVDDQSGSVGANSSIAISPEGTPYITYYDQNTVSLNVARYVGSGGNCDTYGNVSTGSDAWECEVINDGSQVGIQSSIAFDKDGVPFVSNIDISKNRLVVASFVGSGGNCDTYEVGHTGSDAWDCTVVDDPTNSITGDTKIAISPNNNPAVLYVNDSRDSIIFAEFVGSNGNCDTYASGSTGSDAWQCTVVDDQTDQVDDVIGLAYSSDGVPFVAYQNDTDDSLIVAKLSLPSVSLTSDKGNSLIPSGDLRYRINDGRSPRSGEPGDCGTALAAMMGYCGMFDNQGDYDSLNTNPNESPIYAGAVQFDSNTELPEIFWEGRTDVAPNTAGTAGDLVLQAYRFGTTNAWETITSDTTSADCNTVDCTLSGSPSGTVSQYFEQEGSEYWIYFRVYQEAHTTSINFKVDKFSAQTTEQRLRGGRIFEDGVRKPLLTE